jgi:hypothetical protein
MGFRWHFFSRLAVSYGIFRNIFVELQIPEQVVQPNPAVVIGYPCPLLLPFFKVQEIRNLEITDRTDLLIATMVLDKGI